MAHNTGFTCTRLGQLLADSGFATVLAKREGFDLWALGLMHNAAQEPIQKQLRACGLNLFDDER